MNDLTDDEKAAQVAIRDQLAQAVGLVVDNTVLDHYGDWGSLTDARRTHFIIEATISALIAQDLVAVKDIGARFAIRLALPEHLQPEIRR